MGKVYSMTIKYLDSKRISALSSDISNIAYTDNTFASGWNTNGSYINVANTNIEVRFTGSGNAGIAKDISSSLVGTSLPTNGVWTLDFDLHYGTLPTIGGNLQFCVGLSDSDQDSICGTDNQKAYLLVVTSISGSNYRYRLYSINGTNVVGATGSLTQIATFSRTAASNQSDYCRLSSDGTNVKLEFFSDINRTVSIESATVPVNGNINGLKYIKTDLYDQSSTTGFTVDIHKVTVVEGAIESRPTNVQDNSILVEKDTAKRYWGSNSTVKVSDIEDKTLVANGSGIGYSGAYIDVNIPNFASYTGDYRLRTLDTTITTTDFVLDFDWWRQGSNNPPNTSAGLVLRSSQSGLSIENSGITSDDYIRTNANDAGTTLEFLWHSAGTSTETSIGTIAVGSIQAWKYMRLTRTDATTLKFEQFSSEARTGSATLTVNYTSLPSSWGLGLKYIGGYCSDANAGGGLHERLQNIDLSSTSNGTLTTWTRGHFDIRGIFGGGGGTVTDLMDYITIATTSNAIDFGDLTVARRQLAGLSSDTRGIFGGGSTGSNTDVMDYVTIATLGNATDFGNLTARRGIAGLANDTRGVFLGGYAGSYSQIMDYVTIATTGNATTFGNVPYTFYHGAGLANDTRGVMGVAYVNGSTSADMFYITIATTGNATSFGTLTVSRMHGSSVNNSTRGVFCTGYAGSSVWSNVMDYITIATTGNATDFGDLSRSVEGSAGVSDDTRGTIAGGITSGSAYNNIDYITIATLGNSTDFGDLTVARQNLAGGVSGG